MMVRVNEDLYVLVKNAEYGIMTPDAELDGGWDGDEDEYSVIDEVEAEAEAEGQWLTVDEDEAQEVIEKLKRKKDANEKVQKMLSGKGD